MTTSILTNDAISTDATFTGATNTAVPSQLAVKTYADTKLSSVAVTAPITGNGTGASPLAMAAATTSVPGYLAAADWTAFNGKQAAYANLTSIGSLANATGVLRNNGAGVFTYEVAGTVTSVASLTLGTTGTDLSSTVATGTTTPVITLQVPTASATNRGALSAADWTTFNGKQAALGFTPINKAGDAGIGALSMGALTAASGTFTGLIKGSLGLSVGTSVTNAIEGGINISRSAYPFILFQTGGVNEAQLRLTAAGVLSFAAATGTAVFSVNVNTSAVTTGEVTGTSFNSITGLSTAAPLVDGIATVGTSTLAARQDHVHPSTLLWSKTTATTLSAWTTAATLIGAATTGKGTLTLLADTVRVGSVVRIRAKGVYGSTTAAPTLDFLLALGGTTVCTSGALSMTTVSMTARPWEMEIELICIATGPTATFRANGGVCGYNTIAVSNYWPMVQNTAVNVNTAVDQAITLTVACSASNAANTITMQHCTIEVLPPAAA